MNKLTNIHAAFVPSRDNRVHAAVVPFRSTFGRHAPDKPAVLRRVLQCAWTKDETGRLACSWAEPSPVLDQSITWRGLCRASAAISMAA
ncbi:MAG: hypothetical protein WCF20_15415 [Methylovirgula sp.]